MQAYLTSTLPSCPDHTCENHLVGITEPSHYQAFGSTAGGSTRYRCKACSRTFAVARRTGLRQRHPDKNVRIFKLLVNKSPMRRICEVEEIAPPTLYQRISFFQQQCNVFAGAYERPLLQGKEIRRLNVAVDRQDYMINWSNQEDRRNVQLHALASADHASGYVFGIHLDFDSSLIQDTVEREAAATGDSFLPGPFRRFARIWLMADYQDAIRYLAHASARNRRVRNAGYGLNAEIEETYQNAEGRADVEAQMTLDFDTQLASHGVQTHSEYTLYGHFYLLERLFRGVGKVRFFLDQESGIRAAALAAFHERIVAGTADAFYVRINKEFTVNERRRALQQSRGAFARACKRHLGLSDSEVELELIRERIKNMATLGRWSDRWLMHPFPSMSEPEKAICYLTDRGQNTLDQLAHLYQRASLHSVDRFFMQVRRRLSLLERPIKTASAQGRTWYGYSPYNPAIVEKLLTIFRVFYNYVLVGEDGRTPAMRLGLASGPVSINDLLKFMPPVEGPERPRH